MIQNRTLAKNTLIQITGKALSTLLGLVAVAILTRRLGTEQFGWYVTATGFLQFIGIIIDFGFTVTTSNLLAEPAFDKNRLFNTLFTWRFFSALVCFVLAPLIFIFFPYRIEIKLAVAITSLSFFANTLNQVFIGYYRQKLSMYIATASEVLGRVLLVTGFAMFSVLNAGFLTLMSAITVASVISSLYLIKNYGKLSFSFDPVISRAIFKKMLPTAVSVIFNTIYLQADRVILPLYVSQSEVGLYGAAYRVLDITTQISAIIMGLVMPLITFAWSRRLTDEFKQKYQLALDMTALVLFPMIAGIFVLSDPIMRLIASSSFTGSGIMLKSLSISIFGTVFGMTFGHIVLAIDRQKEALLVYGSDAMLSLTGYLIFIPQYGWRGAVLVTVFSEIYAGLFLWLLAVVYSGVIPKFSSVGKIAVASLTMATVLSWLNLSIIPSILAGAAIYSLAAFVLGIIKPGTIRGLFKSDQIAIE